MWKTLEYGVILKQSNKLFGVYCRLSAILYQYNPAVIVYTKYSGIWRYAIIKLNQDPIILYISISQSFKQFKGNHILQCDQSRKKQTHRCLIKFCVCVNYLYPIQNVHMIHFNRINLISLKFAFCLWFLLLYSQQLYFICGEAIK